MISPVRSQSTIEEMSIEVWGTGNTLLVSPASRDELLNLLTKAESILSRIYQEPSCSTAKALLPIMNALISEEIFKHSDVDIQVAVASCLNELTRITAPEYSYSDELMQDIFELLMTALKQLPCGTDVNFNRARRILDTMAAVRTCVMMWDLELDEMVVEMFQLFFDTIKLRETEDLLESVGAMETILVMMINDSDEVSQKLLMPLLESVKIETKDSSLESWLLGEMVFKKCSAKIKPYLKEAWKTLNLNLNEYAEIIRTLCEDTDSEEIALMGEHAETVPQEVEGPSTDAKPSFNAKSKDKKYKLSHGVNDEHETSLKAYNCARNIVKLKSRNPAFIAEAASSAEDIKAMDSGPDVEPGNGAETSQSELETVSRQRRRGRKPNSLLRPEEGYAQPWTVGRGRSKRTSLDGSNRRRGFSKKKDKPESPNSKPSGEECSDTSTPAKPLSPVSEGAKEQLSNDPVERKVKALKPPVTVPAKEAESSLLPVKEEKEDGVVAVHGENLVKTRIMVWWPLDKTFYTGTIESFDPETKKHKIIYDDDEEEVLDLATEKWQLFNEGRSRQIPDADTSPPTTEMHEGNQSSTMKRKRNSSGSQQGVTRLPKRLKAECPSGGVKTGVSVK